MHTEGLKPRKVMHILWHVLRLLSCSMTFPLPTITFEETHLNHYFEIPCNSFFYYPAQEMAVEALRYVMFFYFIQGYEHLWFYE